MSVIKTSEGWQRAWGDQESGLAGEDRSCLVRLCGSAEAGRETPRVNGGS